MTTTSSTLTWALSYLNRGWAVMPLKPKGKEPLLKSWREYQATPPTKTEVAQWFTKWPTANIAILTGSLSRLVVIDADGESGRKSSAELQLNSPMSVQTANGRHYYFIHPGSGANVCNAVRKWPGIDIRADGGYVVAPPSIHPSGRPYTWTESCTTAQLPSMPLWLASNDSNTEVSQPSGNWIAGALKNLKQGNRNDTLTRIVGRLHDGNTHPGDIFSLLAPHSRGCGIDDGELDTIISSVTRYERKSDGDQFDIFTGKNLDEFKQYLARGQRTAGLSTSFRTIDAATGGLRKGEIFTIGARTGIGKTSLSLHIARHLLEGDRKVLLFTTEMSRFSILERLLAGLGPDGLNQLGRYGARLNIVDKSSPTIQDVQKVAKEVGPDVLFFDHLQHTGGSAQSERENVSRFVRGIKDVGRGVGCAVVACSQIRRLPHGSGGHTYPPSLSDLKESGTIEEESGAVLLLSALSEATNGGAPITLEATLAKNRYGPPARFALEFDGAKGTFKEA